MNRSTASTEFELIQRIQARVSTGSDVVLGIGDDAAILAPTAGHFLVTTTDSLILDRHFESDWTGEQIGHLAMTMNASDLAAMGAFPKWAMLSLTLPIRSRWATAEWLDGFLDGFLNVCPEVSLVGGNFSEGPLNICVCLLGEVPSLGWVTRQGAQAGDVLLVTGSLGDAAGALKLRTEDHRLSETLQHRLRYPTARLGAGQQAVGIAHAMIDISDGLLADLGHVLHASGDPKTPQPLGACIELGDLPTSDALREVFPDQQTRWPLQLAGGSDYELLLVVPPARVGACVAAIEATQTPITAIGKVTQSTGIRLIQPNGEMFEQVRQGWDHFVGH